MDELFKVITDIRLHAERGVSVGPEVMRRWLKELRTAQEDIDLEMQAIMQERDDE